MTIKETVSIGVTANELSKEITGSSEVSASRSAVATGTGAALGAASTGALVVAGAASAPIVAPVAAVSAGIAFLTSRFW